MRFETWILFCFSAFMIAASPGPSVLHAIRYASLNGFYKATASILGNTVAILLVCAAASIGLSLIQNTIFFKIIEIVGAVYLIYLGIKIILTANSVLNINNNFEKYHYKHIFFEAFFLSLANPKILLFIAAFFPPFIKEDGNLYMQFFIMSITFAFFTTSTLFLYAGASIAFLKKQKIIKVVNWLSGIVLIGLGIQLFFSI